LAADNPRPAVPTYRGATRTIPLPAGLRESLAALSKREGVTLFMTWLAAFKTLLYKYTAESEIVVGTTAANRDRAELEHLIGIFTNTLPLRTDLNGNPRFTELLKRVRAAVLNAHAHLEMPFEKAVETIGRPGQMPFNVIFEVQNDSAAEVRMAGLKIVPMTASLEPAKVELTLRITRGAETTQAEWIYNPDLFREETIVRMHNHFEALLFSIVARPDAPLDELEILSEAEKAQQSIDRAARKEQHYSRFKSMKPKAIALSED
jgi:non-ribosomal peptide synthetase component F